MYKVLIVDDEDIIREALEKGIMWGDFGFIVSGTASNGREALIKMEVQLPDVVLTDVKMQDIDGLELIDRINDRYPDVKMVIISGYDDFSYAQKAIELGVYSYILKPVKESEIRDLFIKLHKDLDAESNYKSKYRLSQKQVEFGQYELLQYFLKRLIGGGYNELDESSIKDKLVDLGINLNTEYVCAVMLSLDGEESGQQDWKFIACVIDLLKEYLEKLNYPFIIYNSNFFIIIHSKIKISNREIYFIGKNLKEYLEALLQDQGIFSATVSMGIGNVYTSLKNLYTSAKEAEYSLKSKFYKGKGIIHTFMELNKNIDFVISNTLIEEAAEYLSDAIISKEQDYAFNYLKEVLKELFLDNLAEASVVYIKCTDLYTILTSKLKQKGIIIDSPPAEELLRQLKKSEDYKELLYNFETFVKEIYLKTRELERFTDNSAINRIKAYLDRSFAQKLNLAELSEIFYMSPSYISTMFKDKTGMNITDYIQNLRLEKAKQLLKNSERQVSEISERVGYPDYRHFCTVFKKNVGISPLQYRMKIFIND